MKFTCEEWSSCGRERSKAYSSSSKRTFGPFRRFVSTNQGEALQPLPYAPLRSDAAKATFRPGSNLFLLFSTGKMLELAHLSDQVLASILAFADVEVTLLWFAGDRLLNSKLARCCPFFRSLKAHAGSTVSRWPRLVSEFTTLKTLFIEFYDISEPIDEVAEHFKQLPSTLTDISLKFNGASAIPFNNPADERFYFERPTSATDMRSGNCWSFADKFPQLKHLKLVEPAELLFFSFTTSSFGIFPPALETLCWSGRIVPMTLFSMLPAGLKRLEFGFDSELSLSVSQVSSLPRGLTHLDYASVADEIAIARLPRSLTFGSFLPSPITLTPSLLAALPPSLDMIYGEFDIDQPAFQATGRPWTSHLPQTLKQLAVGNWAFTATEIAHLPRTLESLPNANVNWSTLQQALVTEGAGAMQSRWPPTLTVVRLGLSNGYMLNSNLIDCFPRTLKELGGIRLGNSAILFAAVIAGLPPSLECLELACYSSAPVDITTTLPQQLKELSFSGTALLASSFSKLPRGLTTLDLSSSTLDFAESSSYASHLPPSITTLIFSAIHVSSFSALPRGLVELTTYTVWGELTDNEMSLLPSSLTALVIRQMDLPPNIKTTSGLFRLM